MDQDFVKPGSKRLLYIDNLRLVIVAFVVMHHLAVTYSGFGSWYRIEKIPLDTLSTVWFAFYLSFQQAYFMGLLFLIAGYFVAGSYDRNGLGHFIGDRFKRLIIPTLIYMVAITPFIGLVELGNKANGFSMIDFLSGTGVMWFAVALFIFSLIYGLIRFFIRKGAPIYDNKQLSPSFKNAVFLIVMIAIFAFLIRIVQPIGTSILNMQFCFFASYIVLFIMGIVAYKSNLFSKISYHTGIRWLITGITLGFLVWLILVGVADKTGNMDALNGGVTWQSAVYSVWESFVAVAMSIGLIAIFREKFDHQSKLSKTLSDNAFAVYMFHPLIIVAVTIALSSVTLYPIAKWLILCVICVPLCFAVTHFVFRRIPFLKNVL
jgi:glucans biosynthesis protein C